MKHGACKGLYHDGWRRPSLDFAHTLVEVISHGGQLSCCGKQKQALGQLAKHGKEKAKPREKPEKKNEASTKVPVVICYDTTWHA